MLWMQHRAFHKHFAGLLALLALCFIAAIHLGVPAFANDRQQAFQFDYENPSPAYAAETGPVITIHRHVSPYLQRGSYSAFANLASSDGFRINWLDAPLTEDVLARTDILAIVNAYSRDGADDYRKHSTLSVPSIYSEPELDLIENWIRQGGALLLLADHSPFAGGTIRLAERFGVIYLTGHAILEKPNREFVEVRVDFQKTPTSADAGMLASHPITDGSLGVEPIDHFHAFGGQAIIPPPDSVNLLTLPQDFEAILTYRLGEELGTAPRIPAGGFSQGLAMDFENGRLAVFGEAGGFTAQRIEDEDAFGLASPDADQNAEFALATLRWLARFEP